MVPRSIEVGSRRDRDLSARAVSRLPIVVVMSTGVQILPKTVFLTGEDLNVCAGVDQDISALKLGGTELTHVFPAVFLQCVIERGTSAAGPAVLQHGRIAQPVGHSGRHKGSTVIVLGYLAAMTEVTDGTY